MTTINESTQQKVDGDSKSQFRIQEKIIKKSKAQHDITGTFVQQKAAAKMHYEPKVPQDLANTNVHQETPTAEVGQPTIFYEITQQKFCNDDAVKHPIINEDINKTAHENTVEKKKRPKKKKDAAQPAEAPDLPQQQPLQRLQQLQSELDALTKSIPRWHEHDAVLDEKLVDQLASRYQRQLIACPEFRNSPVARVAHVIKLVRNGGPAYSPDNVEIYRRLMETLATC